ncbi:MAG: DUF885 family protein, partial [Oscillospiraceae bacterium]
MKKVLAIIIAIALITGVTGCSLKPSKSSGNQTSNITATQNGDYTQESLLKLCDQFFDEGLKLDILNANFMMQDYSYLNIKPELKLFDENQEDPYTLYYTKVYEELSKYKDVKLDENIKFEYDIIMNKLSVLNQYKDYEYFYDPLTTMNNTATDILYLLSEYRFNNEENIKEYLTLLSQYEKYIDEIISYENQRAKNGFTMTKYNADGIIEQMNDVLFDNYLYGAFDERIKTLDFLSDDKKDSYIAENKKSIEKNIAPALNKLIDFVKTIKYSASSSLAATKEGKKYYEVLFKDKTGCEKDLEEIYSMLKKAFDDSMSEITALLSKNPNLYNEIYKGIDKTSDFNEMVGELFELQKNDFPQIDKISYKVASLPTAQQNSGFRALYFTAPIDNPNLNNIYVNEKYMNPKELGSFVTIAHESTPGHMYQTNYFYRTNPMKLRHLMNYVGYLEGWTTYIENFALKYADLGGEEATRLAQIDNYFGTLVYSLVEMDIHYKGTSKEDIIANLQNYGFDSRTSENIYNSLESNPGVYISYGVGGLEMMNLSKRLYEKTNDYKKVNQAILEAGPCS